MMVKMVQRHHGQRCLHRTEERRSPLRSELSQSKACGSSEWRIAQVISSGVPESPEMVRMESREQGSLCAGVGGT